MLIITFVYPKVWIMLLVSVGHVNQSIILNKFDLAMLIVMFRLELQHYFLINSPIYYQKPSNFVLKKLKPFRISSSFFCKNSKISKIIPHLSSMTSFSNPSQLKSIFLLHFKNYIDCIPNINSRITSGVRYVRRVPETIPEQSHS